jgi:hypothetical protein
MQMSMAMRGERPQPQPHAGLNACHHLARRHPMELILNHILLNHSCEYPPMNTGEIGVGLYGKAA